MNIDVRNCNFKDTCAKYKRGDCDINSPFCIRLFKLNSLQDNALLTADQRKRIPLRLDADLADQKIFNRLKDIENSIESYVTQGNNLYLYSTICGNGKTRWALRLMNTYFEKVWYNSDMICRGLFINVPRFLLALKDNISQKSDYIQHIKENVLDADIVIWDEIGSKGLTVFENENVLSLINSRIEAGKSNIYTSNLDAAGLKDAVGERLYSRIFHLSECLEFTGADKRGLN